MPRHHEVVYGIFVYDIITTLKVPYQLTFERDLYHKRTNVSLVNLIFLEKFDNDCNPDLRKDVVDSFLHFFESNPTETVYFEIDLATDKGVLKFKKFLRWFLPFKDRFIIKPYFTDTEEVFYVEVYIAKKQEVE